MRKNIASDTQTLTNLGPGLHFRLYYVVQNLSFKFEGCIDKQFIDFKFSNVSKREREEKQCEWNDWDILSNN